MQNADQSKAAPGKPIDAIHFLSIVSGRRPKHVPPAYWRRIVDGDCGVYVSAWIPAIGSIVTLFVLIIFTLSLVMRVRIGSHTSLLLAVVIVLQTAPLWVTLRRLKRRFAAELVQAGGLICPDCGYSLVGSTESDPCPECGAAIDRQEIVNLWQQVFPSHFDAMFAEHGPHALLSTTDAQVSRCVVSRRIGLLRVITRRRPGGIPNALWMRVVCGRSTTSLIAVISAYLVAISVGLLAALIGAGIFGGFGKLLDWYLIEGLLVLFVLIGVGLLMFHGSVHAIRTRVEAEIRESAYQRCLECGHRVTTSTSCTECGADFDVEAAMAIWRAAIPELRV